MKIQGEQLQHIQKEIKTVLDENPGIAARYEAGNFPRADLVKDLQKRFCFDLFYAAKLHQWAGANLPRDVHDDHIYTALKTVCPKVTRRY